MSDRKLNFDRLEIDTEGRVVLGDAELEAIEKSHTLSGALGSDVELGANWVWCSGSTNSSLYCTNGVFCNDTTNRTDCRNSIFCGGTTSNSGCN